MINLCTQHGVDGMTDEKVYDIVIIGGGPAGLTAALYAARYKMNTIVIGGELPGGLISEAHEVCNFPTYKSISGMELSQKMIDQVMSYGIEIKYDMVVRIIRENDMYRVVCGTGSEYLGKTIILATGSRRRKIGVPGEEEYTGKGVSYCATCDAAFYRDKVVAVVGGSNSALTAALLLSNYARKVYIIYRGERFWRPEQVWVEQVMNNPKIEVLFKSNVKEILGDDNTVTGIKLTDDRRVDVDGVFIEIGTDPNTDIAKDLGVDMDDRGYIKVNKKQETSLPGVYAAGDVTDNPLKQAITACGEGAIAADSAYQYIRSQS